MECFTVQVNDVEGRIDPYFYRPEFLKLEKKIKSKSTKVLGDYILRLSGGATPSRNNDTELYSNKEEGIPFLRVQNITEEGLVLDDVKYITKDVHKIQLKRSQVREDNLLVTITGRIASSCVVPKDFEGNINQHSVVIKTKNRDISLFLATFLNSHIGQKLALRRTSGGSRLALDYNSLKSIPVVEEEQIVELMDEAYKTKKDKEQEAKELLDSINNYVLNELGIEVPEIEDKKCFSVSSEEIVNNRVDAFYNQPKFKEIENVLENSNNEIKTLKEITKLIKTGATPHQSLNPYTENEEIIFFRNTNLKENELDLSDVKYVRYDLEKGLIYSRKNDLLICIAGTIGVSAVNSCDKKIAINQNVSALKLNDTALPKFVSILLNLPMYEDSFKRVASLATIYYINNTNLLSIKVPIPTLEIQAKIVEEVEKRINNANKCKKDAIEKLNSAKQRVEEILLK